MARTTASYSRIMKKALPALLVILLVFVSLMFLIRYTEAFFLVILAWFLIPVLLVKGWRRIKAWVK